MDCEKAIASNKSVPPQDSDSSVPQPESGRSVPPPESVSSVPPPESGSSAAGATEAEDLLQWAIRTRRRRSRRPRSVVTVEVGQPSEPPEPEKAETDLPVKKRICKEEEPVEGGGGRVVQNFDLNKLPEPEDEQEM